MAYTLGLRPTGLETKNKSCVIPYRLIGETDAITARLYCESTVPLRFGNMYRTEVRMVYQGAGVWDVDAEYGNADRREPSLGNVKWSFDTTGKTRHITQCISHVNSYVPSGKTVIDNKGAIGVTDDSVEGVDIPDRAYKWTETWQLSATSYGFTYSTVLGALTGCTNASYFRGFPAYTVLFNGCGGGSQSADGKTREYSFSFEVSPSAENLTVGDITGIKKVGWDYMWVRYESTDEAAAKKTTPKARQVNVDRVMYSFDYSVLGIGSGVLS